MAQSSRPHRARPNLGHVSEPVPVGAATKPAPDLVIISGMSGAGRSTAANALEDLGWFVIDNLPPALILPMVELAARSQGAVPQSAVVVDVRGRPLLWHILTYLARLGAARHGPGRLRPPR